MIGMALPSGEAAADELGEVVDGADQGPFMSDIVEAVLTYVAVDDNRKPRVVSAQQ